MAFTARSADDITLAMAARVKARTKLTDIAPGSDLRFLLQAVGEEVAYVEQRLRAIRDSFNILNPNIALADLDERLLELPTPQARQKAVQAAGAVLTVTRIASAQQQTLPAGAIFGRADGVTYKTLQAYVFAPNVLFLTGVSATCVSPGSIGNCAAGEINTISSAPSWVVSVVNASALTSGIDEETKAQAQARMALYLQSLSSSQPAALAYAALTFLSAGGGKLKFAKIAINPQLPGQSVLVVDDGSGMAGITSAAVTVSAIVPAVGVRTLWHEAPATGPIPSVLVTPANGGAPYYLNNGIEYDSLYERGVVRLRPTTILQAGDIWQIGNYSIYTGIIRELQRELDGDPGDPANKPGWVAAGCRVFVQPPLMVLVSLDVHIVPLDGYDIAALAQSALDTSAAYMQTLGPGEPLFVAQLSRVLLDIPGMRNVHLFAPNTNTPLADQYPDEVSVLRSSLGTIKVFPTLP